MTFIVRGVFDQPEAAQAALEELYRCGLEQNQIAFRSRFANTSFEPQEHDSILAASLSGRIIATMSSTGYTLAGNSTLADRSLADIGSLLADVAAQEEAVQNAPVRIDALIRTQEHRTAQQASDALKQAGAFDVRIANSRSNLDS